MNLIQRNAVRAAIGVLAAAAIPTAAPLAAQGAAAPMTVNLTVSPNSTTVGDQVTVTATLTNNTASTTSGALGIENPDYRSEHITAVSPGCRNVVATIYCGNPRLAPGATMTLNVTFTATTAGTIGFTAYGHITNVNDSYCYGTLTVS